VKERIAWPILSEDKLFQYDLLKRKTRNEARTQFQIVDAHTETSKTPVLRQTMYVESNNEARSSNRCCSGKAVIITYSECVSIAFGIQHATGKRLIASSSVTCLALAYFSTISHKRRDFRGGGGGDFGMQNVCFDFLWNFVWNISHVKYTLFL
jgi:hypothetical protein